MEDLWLRVDIDYSYARAEERDNFEPASEKVVLITAWPKAFDNCTVNVH